MAIGTLPDTDVTFLRFIKNGESDFGVCKPQNAPRLPKSHRMASYGFQSDFGKVCNTRVGEKIFDCFWTTRFVTENKMDDHRSGRDDRKHNSYALVLSELYRVTYAN